MLFFLIQISKIELQEKVINLEREITNKQKELHRIREQLDSAKEFDQDLKNRINFIENSHMPYPPQKPIENEFFLFNSTSKEGFFKKILVEARDTLPFSKEITFQSNDSGPYSSIRFGKPEKYNCYPSSFHISIVLNKDNQISLPKVNRQGEFYSDINFPFPIQFSQIKITLESTISADCFPKIYAKGFH
ncbi:hypothetical protein TVAG_250010 [Trichomonas vaginalis G3]|uniref:Uncharacterized protein n=1 Tax=Trichomonas vaginalis (strain ATCC PRA-98 / G3) TaxID=412133 RepID=A2DCK4_TRIV3|nr:hypothetical protein TVAGG3_0956330 [Trichomonas vaginalis G3]EAY21941.1 hypothetical protein TVAG_250010 [Trichomonas vaginalis G3]KAI5487583.1 hypothetical protein TVAGG3_0956330 [Trichomonas vaginalis G3]|eukprot:XP_001582927.1 hypothetical protein [Trichomonas vaginalis G3]